MPKYSVSCTIHEVVLPQIPTGTPIDPLVVIRCFGAEQSTSVKVGKTSVVIWDESFYWNNLNIDAHAWSVGTLDFELQSANAFWRNTTLGTCSLQLKLISTSHHRTFSGKLPITAPNSVAIVGYLTVTVNAYDSTIRKAEGGNIITLHEHVDEDAGASGDTSGNVPNINDDSKIPPLTSPLVCRSGAVEASLEYKYHHLYINIYTLEHLESSFFGNSPYITCEYAGCRLQSEKPIRARFNGPGLKDSTEQNIGESIKGYISACRSHESHRCNYTFNQCFLIPVCSPVGKPTLEDNVIVRIWMGMAIDIPYISGSNSFTSGLSISPKLIAEGIFSLSRLRAQRLPPRWFNFYTTDKTLVDDKHAHFAINESQGQKLQAAYLGRILMSASVKRITKASNVLKAHVASSHALEQYNTVPSRILCDVYSIDSQHWFDFDSDFSVCIEISCGPFSTCSDWSPIVSRGPGGSGTSHVAVQGWFAKFDSIKGRVVPLNFLAPPYGDEQWFVLFKVLGMGLKNGTNVTRVLGTIQFDMADVPVYSANTPSIPFWLTTCLKGPNSPMVNVLLTLQRLGYYNASGALSTPMHEPRYSSVTRRIAMIKVDYELRCYLFCAKLKHGFANGKLMVTVACNGIVAKSNVILCNTHFPVFLQCLTSEVTVMTLPVSGVASLIPILVSLIIELPSTSEDNFHGQQQEQQQQTVHMECATTNYSRLVLGPHTSPMPKPKWLQLSGGSSILLCSELVSRSKAPTISFYQMAPPLFDVDFQLSLLGLRNVSLPPNCRPESIVLASCMQSYGLVGVEQTYEKLLPWSSCKHWFSDGLWNIDMFTVLNLTLKVPVDAIFDPHVEVVCYYTLGGRRFPLGYHAFAIFMKRKHSSDQLVLDLRFNLKPLQMCLVLESLCRRKDAQVFNLTSIDPAKLCSSTKDDADLELVKQQNPVTFKNYKTTLKSLQPENIGIYIPPRFIVVANGRSVPRSTSVDVVCNDQLDKLLKDIPYSTVPLLNVPGMDVDKYNAANSPSTAATTARSSSSALGITIEKTLIDPLHWVGLTSANTLLDAADDKIGPEAFAKYMLSCKTINNTNTNGAATGKSGAGGGGNLLNVSYSRELEPLASEPRRLLKAFRGSLQGKMFKIRLCLVSVDVMLDETEDLNLVVCLGGNQIREHIQGQRVTNDINRTLERDFFIPQDFIINVKVTRLDVNDHDVVLASLCLDLEHRWFSKSWRRLSRKNRLPTERLSLLDSRGNVQGTLKLLIQMDSLEHFGALKPLVFSKVQPNNAQIRLIIWSTRGVKVGNRKSLDLYLVTNLDCRGYKGDYPLEQNTDVHYNCTNGNAVFNWRIVYPNIDVPLGACQLTLQLYDFYKVASPVYLAECNLELKTYLNNVAKSSNKIQVDGEIPLVGAGQTGPLGYVQVTLQVLTSAEAAAQPVGLGRKEPNCKPFLVTPIQGRRWHDVFAHPSFGFGKWLFYIKLMACVLLLFWMGIIGLVYPAILMR